MVFSTYPIFFSDIGSLSKKKKSKIKKKAELVEEECYDVLLEYIKSVCQ